jgi:hypothetical protein
MSLHELQQVEGAEHSASIDLSSPGGRLAGGTDEILRNIQAERVLRLPPEIRLDKDEPFSDIPSGSSS